MPPAPPPTAVTRAPGLLPCGCRVRFGLVLTPRETASDRLPAPAGRAGLLPLPPAWAPCRLGWRVSSRLSRCWLSRWSPALGHVWPPHNQSCAPVLSQDPQEGWLEPFPMHLGGPLEPQPGVPVVSLAVCGLRPAQGAGPHDSGITGEAPGLTLGSSRSHWLCDVCRRGPGELGLPGHGCLSR